jgi:hypothetical protein
MNAEQAFFIKNIKQYVTILEGLNLLQAVFHVAMCDCNEAEISPSNDSADIPKSFFIMYDILRYEMKNLIEYVEEQYPDDDEDTKDESLS